MDPTGMSEERKAQLRAMVTNCVAIAYRSYIDATTVHGWDQRAVALIAQPLIEAEIRRLDRENRGEQDQNS